MPTLQKTFFHSITTLITLSLLFSCTDDKDDSSKNHTHIYPDTYIDTVPDIEEDITEDVVAEDIVEISEPDTYEQDCIVCEYYFCRRLYSTRSARSPDSILLV